MEARGDYGVTDQVCLMCIMPNLMLCVCVCTIFLSKFFVSQLWVIFRFSRLLDDGDGGISQHTL